jgi:hypothetical protein
MIWRLWKSPVLLRGAEGRYHIPVDEQVGELTGHGPAIPYLPALRVVVQHLLVDADG